MYQAEKLLRKFRREGKKFSKFDDLEKLAVEYHKQLGQIMMNGVVGDKGTGKDLPIPNEVTANGKVPKYKGLKKKYS